MAEEAIPTQWDLTEIYENMDACQVDYDRAMEILPQYESYQGTLNTAQGFTTICRLPTITILSVDNRDFSRATRIAGAKGKAAIFKNHRPR